MCLAVPMRVIEIKGQEALVELEGIRRSARLDLVARRPVPGDYLIIHAGFAIHVLDQEQAEENLRLMHDMAAGLDRTQAT